MATTVESAYVRRIETFEHEDLALAGGKGANLGELARAGFPIPSGFVVTTDAYRALTDTQSIREAIDELEALDPAETEELAATAERIRSLVREQEFDEGVAESITDALDTDGDTSYAVRSSATAEDLPSASFAGQHETFLGVPREDVLDRVRECMASLFTDRAVAYRARNDVSHSEVAMAVVVQEMAAADAAGVLFTADPDTNNRTVASIDATYGLGDTVVSGEVSADNARVDKRAKEVLDYEVGEKATELTLDGIEGGTHAASTTPSRRRSRALSDAKLRTLVEVGNRIEALFGTPQDIEWALVEGEFVVLQSRPITSLIAPPEPRPDDDSLHVYFSIGHGQAMTDPMPPLALDLWTAVYTDVMNGMLGTDTIWAARTEGRAYVDITSILGFGVVRNGIARYLGVVSESGAEGATQLFDERGEEFGGEFSLASLPTVLRKAVELLPGATRAGLMTIPETIEPFYKGANGAEEYRAWFHAWGSDLEADVLDTEDPEALVENAFVGFPAFGDMKSKAMGAIVGPTIGRIVEGLVPGADAELVDAAARGVEADIGTRMTLSLGDLADIARETPATEEAILDERPIEEVRGIDGSEAFLAEFDAFLSEFGHRAASEFDPSRPRWRDAPGEPLGIVRGNLIADEKGAHRERLQERQQEAKAAIDELRANARKGLSGPVRGRLVDRLLSTYRAYVHLRDEPKHEVAHLFAAWHEALQRVGEHLAREGVLTQADDVWYLHHEELLDLLEGGETVPDVEARRAAHERHERIEAPPLITSEGEIPRAERADLGENELSGTGVSSGVIEGVARIIHDPSEADLKSGDILVCPSTDPAWTPLFATAGGLVAEVGGRFTHGALVAREYGLPAVVSVAGATEAITDGQTVRVDGTQGIVELLDD